MNPRDAVLSVRRWYDEAIFPPRPAGPHTDVYDGEAAAVARNTCDAILRELDALTAAGFVIVACPPGSRVVVDRTPKPCQTCVGRDFPPELCTACDGSGVVEATTTSGLVVDEELLTVPNICNHMSSTFCPRTDHKREPWSYRLVAVALPEETPQ